MTCECVNMHRFLNIFHIFLLNICANNIAATSCWSEKLHSAFSSFESREIQYFSFPAFDLQMREESSWEIHFGVDWKPVPTFVIAAYTEVISIYPSVCSTDQILPKYAIFVGWVTSALYKYAKITWHRDTCYTSINSRNWPLNFQISPEEKFCDQECSRGAVGWCRNSRLYSNSL